ncbi:MAG: hypothetical protein AAGF12_07815 [Myxococcota bacterium]
MGIGRTEIEETAGIVQTHPAVTKLSRLAFDILSRQGESQAVVVGKPYVERRAEEHGLGPEEAKTDGGDVLDILERGPESDRERAVVSALAVAGFGTAVAATPENELETVRRFVRHADWHELSSPYALYAFVDTVLDRDLAAKVWREVGTTSLADQADEVKKDSAARQAMRVSVLRASTAASARETIAHLQSESGDPTVALLLPADLDGQGAVVAGRVSSVRSLRLEVFRWVTGWAILSWLGRLLGTLLGVRHLGELRVVRGGVHYRHHWAFLGRTVRTREETFTTAALSTIGRRARYPFVHTLVGLLCLSAGVLLGGFLVFDGVRSGETFILMAGAVVMLLGGGLDFALEILLPARRETVGIDLAVLPKRQVRLDRVEAPVAEQFLQQLRKRL